MRLQVIPSLVAVSRSHELRHPTKSLEAATSQRALHPMRRTSFRERAGQRRRGQEQALNMEPTTKPDETAVRCTSVMGGIVCNGVMRRGIAIPPAWQCSDEGTCSYASWSAVAPRVSVLKCERCGHSFVPPIDEVSDRRAHAPENTTGANGNAGGAHGKDTNDK